MKALIISDDISVSSHFKKVFENHNVDTILYKWFLKALDNIEEIQPDIILLNTSEYPRLWKTLAQFVNSGLGGDKVQIYLYEPIPLTEDDLQKENALCIKGHIRTLLADEAEEVFGFVQTEAAHEEAVAADEEAEFASVETVAADEEAEFASVETFAATANSSSENEDSVVNNEDNFATVDDLVHSEKSDEYIFPAVDDFCENNVFEETQVEIFVEEQNCTESTGEEESFITVEEILNNLMTEGEDTIKTEDSSEQPSVSVDEDINQQVSDSSCDEENLCEQETDEIKGEVVYTNPHSNHFENLHVISFDNDELVCTFENENVVLYENSTIQFASYEINDEIKSFSADVTHINSDNHTCTLCIKEFY